MVTFSLDKVSKIPLLMDSFSLIRKKKMILMKVDSSKIIIPILKKIKTISNV